MGTDLLTDLQARGLVADMTAAGELEAHLATASRILYCGFDPTADSLHVGSLLPLLALRRFQLAGHRPIVLIGGGTGLIGDPSGKATERVLNAEERVAEWAERLKTQVSRFVDFEAGPGAARLLDNHAWLGPLHVIPFLRDIGKEFPVGAMMARESVRSRMGRADSGLSYTEFSYQILQAFDFLTLYREHGCTLQIGGSDQWGNITAGIDLIRRKTGKTAHGLTLPLVTKSDGTKFGKTESGTIWLDPSRTTAYEMYQFWLNTADADVDRYLRYFTFLPLSRIDDLAEATRRSPEEREAQRVLAAEVTALIHGEDAVTEAEAISAVLFTGKVDVLTPEQAAQASRAMTATEMSPGFEALPAVDLVTAAKLAESKKRARELMAAGAIQVNGKTLAASDVVSERHALHGRYFFVRRGKKTYHAVVLAR